MTYLVTDSAVPDLHLQNWPAPRSVRDSDGRRAKVPGRSAEAARLDRLSAACRTVKISYRFPNKISPRHADVNSSSAGGPMEFDILGSRAQKIRTRTYTARPWAVSHQLSAFSFSELKTRVDGTRIKHWVCENSIKMYDKQGCVLRIKTTIHNPRRWRVWRRTNRKGKRCMAWIHGSPRIQADQIGSCPHCTGQRFAPVRDNPCSGSKSSSSLSAIGDRCESVKISVQGFSLRVLRASAAKDFSPGGKG